MFFFCFDSKKHSSWDNRTFFFKPEPTNFSALEGPGVEFPAIQNCPKKINLDLIKLVLKQKRANRKWHTSFFGFDFLNFKLVLINAQLDFSFENQTYCYQKIGQGTLKSSQTWRSGLKLKKKNTFVTERLKMGQWWDQTVCIFKTPGFVAPT